MKKLTAFALALVMALGLLSGCGSSNSDSNTPSGDDASDAAAKTKLVVATSPDFPPFESLEGSEVVGILPMQALLDCAEYYLQIEDFSVEQVLEFHL